MFWIIFTQKDRFSAAVGRKRPNHYRRQFLNGAHKNFHNPCLVLRLFLIKSKLLTLDHCYLKKFPL